MESTDHRSSAVTAGGGGPRASRTWLAQSDLPQRPANVREALRALDAVTERLLGDDDARATFPDVYAIVTRQMAERVDLGAGAFFHDPRWISRLAGRFCERYLDTLRWSLAGSAQDCDAWDIAYDACERGGRLPIQHLMLGISAHINYDLAIGVYRTLAEGDVAPDSRPLRRYKHDLDRVNDLLQASIPEVFAHLIGRHRCDASRLIFRRAYTLSRWAALQILASWRARVWDDALAMLGPARPRCAAGSCSAWIAARGGTRACSPCPARPPRALAGRPQPARRAPHSARPSARLSSRFPDYDGAASGPKPRSSGALRPQRHTRGGRPASVATTAVSSAGSMGLGRCDEYPASSARVRSWTVA